MTTHSILDRLPKAGGIPVIHCVNGELPRMVVEAEAALISANAGIYERAGLLCRIAQLERDDVIRGVQRRAGQLMVLPVTTDFLRLALSRAATFTRFDKREKAERLIDPPANIAASLLAAAGEWKFPVLRGIVTAPTLRADGSLLNAPGYDEISGLFASFDPVDFPSINPAPSRDDALAALGVFDDLFGEFRFSGGDRSAHASTAIAAIVTGCQRHALPTAPAVGVGAAKVSEGKTALAKVVATVQMGREPAVIAVGDDERELKKALLALLLGGDQCVIIDNVEHEFASPTLCAILTAPTYSDRMLGVSQKVTVSTAVMVLITGNALTFAGDLTSRLLLCELDTGLERPDNREFKRDIISYVQQHRGMLVKSALEITLAYQAAGSPAVKAPHCRFREWDARVRRPLIWAGCADPLDTMERVRASDPVREALAGLLAAWEVEFGIETVSVAKCIETASAPGQRERPQLRDALLNIAGDKTGDINARRLGRYLLRNVRRIEGGLRLEDCGRDGATWRKLYRVTRVLRVSIPNAREMAEKCELKGVGYGNADNEANEGLLGALRLPV